MCIEEISWCQRIVGFKTPEEILKLNSQQEFNIHNLHFILPHIETVMNVIFTFTGFSILILLKKIEEVPQKLHSIIPNKDSTYSLLMCLVTWTLQR